ncbi:MAG TPA: U32 family peptidase [Elusimicrobiota bacterium]|jgi:putative protease|nr:U32 family peptidase [Elusimicrobiota bacterium]
MEARPPELLLPVGDRAMALAAIHNGADAIYVGFPGFNARGRTADLAIEELRELIELCHLYGVKVNLAFNILMFETELAEVLPALEAVLALKPDAFILQDLGLAAMIRRMAPGQVLHASTQMTVTNHDAIALLADLDFKRFVLGRENSLPEIRLIKTQSKKELEVFVHGALCVAYSGQCFTSESLGGRSANRGQCAQSCRLSYELHVDGERRELGDLQFLVSPKDLCAIDMVPDLIDAGVGCFKVEGRLKSPEYVAESAREYRAAIEAKAEGRTISPEELEAARRRMGSTYSRGFTPGWLNGVRHQELVDGRTSAHRGYEFGVIRRVSGKTLFIETTRAIELSPGDGVSWALAGDAQANQKKSEGAQVYGVRRGELLELEFGRDSAIRPELAGARVFLNLDHNLKKELQKSVSDRDAMRRVPIRVEVRLAAGSPLSARFSDGLRAVEASGGVLAKAEKRPSSDDAVAAELSALGATPFVAAEVKIERASDEGLFVPNQELKRLRQALTEKLEAARKSATIDGFAISPRPARELQDWLAAKRPAAKRQGPVAFHLLLRNIAQAEQVSAAVSKGELRKAGLDSVALDFEFGRDYAPALETLRAAGLRAGIATTRILKPQEYANLRAIERLKPDFILVRNLGALHYFTKISPFSGELRGDFSLNVANHVTADYLLGKGLKTVCVSYDLSAGQVEDLLRAGDAARLEVTVHQYMPSFHMEHCVFAALLSKGNSFRDCGKPCERHELKLKDQSGHWHFIKPDQECRNTMFNANAQSAAGFLARWAELGLGHARLEALNESGAELIYKISAYQDILSGATPPREALAELSSLEAYGLGRGALGREKEYQSRKKQA